MLHKSLYINPTLLCPRPQALPEHRLEHRLVLQPKDGPEEGATGPRSCMIPRVAGGGHLVTMLCNAEAVLENNLSQPSVCFNLEERDEAGALPSSAVAEGESMEQLKLPFIQSLAATVPARRAVSMLLPC